MHSPHTTPWSKHALILSVYGFVLFALMDPADQIFHAKAPLFVLILTIWLFRVMTGKSPIGELRTWIIVLVGGLLIPLVATLIGRLHGPTPPEIASYGVLKSFLMLLLIPVVVNERTDLLKVLIRMSILVSLATIGMAAMSLISPIIFEVIYNFTVEKQNAMIATSQSHFGLAIGSFYYKTAAILVFPLAYHWNRILRFNPRRWMSIVRFPIHGAAVFLSGTRANVLLAAAIIVVLWLLKVARTLGSRLILGLVAAILVLPAAPLLMNLFDPGEISNEVKLEHYRSYLNEFGDHPTYLLWGQGADTEFYTSGFQRKTEITELSYLELVRTFGIPVTLLLVVGFLFPVGTLWGAATNQQWVVVAYISYLIGAASNPLLISSTGLLVVIAVWQRAAAAHVPYFTADADLGKIPRLHPRGL